MSLKTSVLKGSKDIKGKTRSLTATNTVGVNLCTVPKGTRLIGAYIHGATPATGETATIGFGTNATATNLGTYSVLAAGIGGGGYISFTNTNVETSDSLVYGIFGSAGAGTSTTGSWLVTIISTDGNYLNNDNV